MNRRRLALPLFLLLALMATSARAEYVHYYAQDVCTGSENILVDESDILDAGGRIVAITFSRLFLSHWPDGTYAYTGGGPFRHFAALRHEFVRYYEDVNPAIEVQSGPVLNEAGGYIHWIWVLTDHRTDRTFNESVDTTLFFEREPGCEYELDITDLGLDEDDPEDPDGRDCPDLYEPSEDTFLQVVEDTAAALAETDVGQRLEEFQGMDTQGICPVWYLPEFMGVASGIPIDVQCSSAMENVIYPAIAGVIIAVAIFFAIRWAVS